MNIHDLLKIVVETGASDLHLTAPSPPVLRIDGQLEVHNNMAELTPHDITQAFIDITTE